VNEDVIDYELLEDLIIHIDEDYEAGAVLVFLPGMAEIQLMKDRLSASRRFSGSASEWLLPLHSSVASSDQRRVFQRPPSGNRKIVLATNIAETSITIDDVVHVIDCGKHNENRFDPRRGMSSMVEAWISQANARQRGGRAGRVRPGNCFCLYTRHRLETLMRPFQVKSYLSSCLLNLRSICGSPLQL
jgi:ATP-dependent RNA helicase DHX29